MVVDKMDLRVPQRISHSLAKKGLARPSSKHVMWNSTSEPAQRLASDIDFRKKEEQCGKGTRETLKEKIKVNRKRQGLDEIIVKEESPKQYKMSQEEEEKDKKRRQSNRESAKRSRWKQRTEIEYIQKEHDELTDKNMDLDVKVKKLIREKQALMQKLSKLLSPNEMKQLQSVALPNILEQMSIKRLNGVVGNSVELRVTPERKFEVINKEASSGSGNCKTTTNASLLKQNFDSVRNEDIASCEETVEFVVMLGDASELTNEVVVHSTAECSDDTEPTPNKYTMGIVEDQDSKAEMIAACKAIVADDADDDNVDSVSEVHIIYDGQVSDPSTGLISSPAYLDHDAEAETIVACETIEQEGDDNVDTGDVMLIQIPYNVQVIESTKRASSPSSNTYVLNERIYIENGTFN